MFTCPHCNRPSIDIWAKYWARTVEPAVCEVCDKPSSIPGFVESVSASLFAGLCALGTFAIGVTKYRGGTLLIYLLVFYVAVEAAKVFSVPLKALSDHEVEKRKSAHSRFALAAAIIVGAVVLLAKCGF